MTEHTGLFEVKLLNTGADSIEKFRKLMRVIIVISVFTTAALGLYQILLYKYYNTKLEAVPGMWWRFQLYGSMVLSLIQVVILWWQFICYARFASCCSRAIRLAGTEDFNQSFRLLVTGTRCLVIQCVLSFLILALSIAGLIKQ